MWTVNRVDKELNSPAKLLLSLQLLLLLFLSGYLQRPLAEMTLQWTAVASFLYAEILILIFLCLPFISARRFVWPQHGHGLWSYACIVSEYGDMLLQTCLCCLCCRWQSIFQLRIWSWMAQFWNKVFLTMIIILIVLFLGEWTHQVCQVISRNLCRNRR